MVEAALDVGVEGLFTGVATGTVPAVVSQSDRFGQGGVQTQRARHAGGHLSDFEGVGQAGAHVVIGEDEDLGLAREAAKRRGVQDPVAVAFEARSVQVGLLVDGPMAGPVPAGGPQGEGPVELLLAGVARGRGDDALVVRVQSGHRIAVRPHDLVVGEPPHGGGPLGAAGTGGVICHDHHLAPKP